MVNKKFPINRMNKFYDESDFSLENDMAREFLEGDLNIVVVLFQVDKIESEKTGDDVYGEVDGDKIKFFPPKELNVRIVLDEASHEGYSEGHLARMDYGDLTFTIFTDHLKELGADISYGDYIGYADSEDNIKYFTVTNDGRINSDNAHTRLGYKSYYRTVKCVTADPDEFNPTY
jgi:hypothetical protein